jgi:hypothetical protein
VLGRRVLTKTAWWSWRGAVLQSLAEASVDRCPWWHVSRDGRYGNKGGRRIGHTVGLSCGTSGVYATCRVTSVADLIDVELARALSAGWNAPDQLLRYLSPLAGLTGD